MSEVHRHQFPRRRFIAAVLIGLLLTLLGTWPMLTVVVPDRLESAARVCTPLALPGILTALAFGQNVHDYSRAMVFFGNLLFYSAVIAALLTLQSLWSRRKLES